MLSAKCRYLNWSMCIRIEYVYIYIYVCVCLYIIRKRIIYVHHICKYSNLSVYNNDHIYIYMYVSNPVDALLVLG